MGRRIDKICTKKLYVKLRSDSPLLTCWGLVCLASEKALFVKSVRSFKLGTTVDMEIFGADVRSCILEGVVSGVVELHEPDKGVCMEIELTAVDAAYISLLKFLDPNPKTKKPYGNIYNEILFDSLL